MKPANDNLAIDRKEAARLCGLSPAGFDVWVRKGIVPPAIAGTHRWSRAALERALGGMPGAVEVELDPYEQWKKENRKVG